MMSPLWSLAVAVAVLAVLPFALHHGSKLRRRHGARAPELEVTAQVTLGPRERVVLLRVQRRVLVLGVTAQSVSLLAETQPDDEVAPTEPAALPLAGFGDLLRRARSPRGGGR